jgi:hypothetical protein
LLPPLRFGEGAGGERSPASRGPSKRKKEGAFYTPAFVTRYIVAETLGPVLRERFERLRAEHEADAGRGLKKVFADLAVVDADDLTKPQTKAQVGFWEAWLTELEGVRILDPACGSGAFLIEAFDQMFAAYTRAFPTPRSWQFVSDVLARTTDDLVHPVVAGCVGDGPAGRMGRELPDQAGGGVGGEADAHPVGARADVDAGRVRVLHGQGFDPAGLLPAAGFALGLGPCLAAAVGPARGPGRGWLAFACGGSGRRGSGRRCGHGRTPQRGRGDGTGGRAPGPCARESAGDGHGCKRDPRARGTQSPRGGHR